MNIAIIGYGKMGREIKRLAAERKITVIKILDEQDNFRGSGISKESMKGVDVLIDFSTPHAAVGNIEAAASCGKNIVVGTTGWYENLENVKRVVLDNKTGLVYSPNFSLGMNLFAEIIAHASALMAKFDMYDVAIHEVHHRMKADSPSGTALMLGDVILQQLRRKKEILKESSHGQISSEKLHVTSARVGNVSGTHEVLFDSEADSIELVHRAKNRSGFALGALIAAEWLNGKKGFFTMRDVLSSTQSKIPQ